MRKTILALAIVGFFYFTYVVLTNWYNNVSADVNGRREVRTELIQNTSGIILDENLDKKKAGQSVTSTQPQPSKPLFALPIASSKTGQPLSNIYICLKEINAYNPVNPSQIIGTFKINTRLLVGSKDLLSGKYFVVYEMPNGKKVQALCKAEDLGK